MDKLEEMLKILGVKKTATKEQIKKAYRKKSKKLHPDAGGSPEEFAKLNRAYEILMDDFKRAKYENGFNPIGDIEKEANAFLFETFQNSIGDKLIDIFGTSKVLPHVEKKIENGILQYQKEIHDAQLERKRFEKIKDCVLVKNDIENFYKDMVNKNIELNNSKIQFAKFKMDILNKAKEILKNYYEPHSDPTTAVFNLTQKQQDERRAFFNDGMMSLATQI
jgi:curved DNA-binding protein CbpA